MRRNGNCKLAEMTTGAIRHEIALLEVIMRTSMPERLDLIQRRHTRLCRAYVRRIDASAR